MPPEETIVATPPVEGVPAEPGSQATPPLPQGNEEPQKAGESKVDTPQSQVPTSPKPERPKPSEFYGFRKETERMREALRAQQYQIEEMKQLLEKKAASGSEPQIPDYLKSEKFWENTPENLLRLQQDARREAIEEMKKNFPQMYKEIREIEKFESRVQEGLELILPKDKEGTKTLEQRYADNKERADKIYEIINTTALKDIKDPVEQARWALRAYEDEIKAQHPVRPVNPNVIDKKLMGGIPSAQPVGGGKKMPTLQEARAEFKRLTQMKDENPDLRHEDTFVQQLSNAKKQLQTLILQEQGNINQ